MTESTQATTPQPWHQSLPQAGTCDVIVFGAHPDDAELLCGGSIAKMTSAGQIVQVIDATRAELSTNGDVHSRQQECAQATQILGVQRRHQFMLPDGQLRQHFDLLVSLLVLSIRHLKPRLIIGPPPSCRHPDHQALHDAMKEAHFFCGLKKYKVQIPEFENSQLSASFCPRPQWIQYVEVADEQAQFLIDITSQWDQRIRAVLAYRSQFSNSAEHTKTFINDGFLERLERRYRHYGEMIGVEFAEPFLSAAPPTLHLPTDICAPS